MPAVTLSAAYGTGGSQIARGVSHRLDYPLLDRAISAEVAQHLNVSVAEAEKGSKKRSFAEKFYGPLSAMSDAVVSPDEQDAINAALIADNDQVFRQSAENIMRAAVPAGVVILGRAGAAALHGLPEVLTVRLFGTTERRIAHAVAAEAVDPATAADRLHHVDKARAHYVRHLYRRDIDDPELYDIQIDSTLVPTEACIDVIAAAFTAFLGAQRITA
jgi:cytidylate kinase